MKKLIIMASMLALMLAAAAPAFASTAIGGDVDFVDSDQTQLSLTQQVNFANDQNLAGVAQDLSVDQSQTLAGEDSVAAGVDFSRF